MKKFLPFCSARKLARSLLLKSQGEWENYYKNASPQTLPSSPSRHYKKSGWKTWMDWLGTNNKPGWQSRRKYTVNNNFFKKWSGDMSYILGFWFADGWIYKNRLGIIQHKKDKYILEQILEIMQSNYNLQGNRASNCCSMVIYSAEIVSDIQKLGGKYRKSLDVEFPHVPKKYLPDFIRGLWDGDGCITYNKLKKCYVSNYTCGSKKFINSMFFLLRNEIENLAGVIYKIRSTTYKMIFGKNDTIRLRDYMYKKGKSNLKLIRKFNKFNAAGNICKIGRKYKNFLSYNDAKKIVKKIGLKSAKEWYKYASTLRPENIPHSPRNYYGKKVWINWYDWLGKKNNFKNIGI